MLFNANEHVIGDEIRAKQDEFGSLMQLGQKMYGRQPGQKTEEKINSLGEDRKVVLRGWQVFNREADQLDASTSAKTKLLKNLSVRDNLTDVDASLKRHGRLKRYPVEKRVGALIEMANRLVDAGQYSSDTVQDRRDMVVQAREKLKANNAKKRAVLDE